MSVVSGKRGVVMVAILALVLSLGNIAYTSQVALQVKTSQSQYVELSEDYRQLQEDYENQLKESGPRYTGNPFTTQLWPGQLQSENITGMHWYSYYGGELVNCTDNVLGLNGGVELEGDYTTWAWVWTRDYVGCHGWIYNVLVDNSGTVYAEDVSASLFVKTYGGVETNIADYHFAMHEIPMSDPMSATGKYMLGTPVYSTTFEVWKDGVQTFSRDVSLDEEAAEELYVLSVSPNGKFIAITAAIGVDKRLVMLYEGS